MLRYLILLLLMSACTILDQEGGALSASTNTPSVHSPSVTPVTPSATQMPPSATSSPTLTATRLKPTVTPSPVATATATEEPASVALTPGLASPHEAPMVVVPAGEFLMGSTLQQAEHRQQRWRAYIDDRYARCHFRFCIEPPADELYQFTAYLDEFEIDKFEVTNHQYQLCVKAGVCSKSHGEPPNHPVVGMTQQQAQTYCQWVGKRLPTEAEWEKAARGTDGRNYPWGNKFQRQFLNISSKLKPAGSYPEGASPYGALDMAGNASEWTSDIFQPYPGHEFPETGELPVGRPVYRGGQTRGVEGIGFPEELFRSAARYQPTDQGLKLRSEQIIGFRCVRAPEQEVKVVSNPAAPKPLATQTTVDLSNMVLVPVGEFIMGTDDFDDSYDEGPAHEAYLDAFYMDKYEVTGAQYAEFLNLYGQHKYACNGVDCLNLDYRDPPITKKDGHYQAVRGRAPIEVSWYGANLYCQWLGKRLPTEAEWEKAARGSDGRKYPWGNEKMPREAIGNSGSLEAVGTHPVDLSPYGLFDMFGNAEEWTQDWYDRDYYTYSPSNNPTGPEEPVSDGYKSVRSGNISHITQRYRHPLGLGTGFRCAVSE